MADPLATVWLPPRNPGPFGRTSAPFKLALGLLLAVWAIVVDHPTTLLVPAAAMALLAFLEPLNTPQRRLLWAASALLTWTTILTQGFFYHRVPREALVTFLPPGELFGMPFDGLRIYRQGLVDGAAQSLRLLTLLFVGLLTAFSTELHALLGGLQRLGVPGALGFLTIAAARSLPTVAAEAMGVRQALKLRHLTLRDVGWAGVVRPLLATTLHRSRTLAAALQVRGIDPTAPALGPLPRCTTVEILLLAMLALPILAALGLRMLWFLYQRGWWYNPDWLSIYLAARWLASR
ncbi:MAG TPA: energy-coupling factor transporter transmembrane component T [bacterium]|nr:energy-coupling factor transporter transmembrane component T [bacterium]